MGRTEIDHLLRELYAARLRGDLDAVCRSFAPDARFQIQSARQAVSMALKAGGVDEYRPLLALLMKTFRLQDLTILAMIIEGVQVTAHWRANIRSRITGATVRTELIDLIEVRDDGCIVDYNEIFVQR